MAAPNQALVDNPYGLEALWATGDIVSKSVLIILVVASMVSWYIIFSKLWDQRRMRKQYGDVQKGFWSAGSLREGMERLKGKDHAFRIVVEDGIRAAEHHEGRMTDQIPLHEWITMSLQRSVEQLNSRLSTGLSFLATVGSTAPFVGLFGTVWGILNALTAIGVAGQASIGKVAGPVGEALIMTAFGLFVAVPAVLGYNWLLRRNKDLTEKLRYFTNDVHAYLVSGARVQNSTTTGAAVPASNGPRPSVAVAGSAPRAK